MASEQDRRVRTLREEAREDALRLSKCGYHFSLSGDDFPTRNGLTLSEAECLVEGHATACQQRNMRELAATLPLSTFDHDRLAIESIIRLIRHVGTTNPISEQLSDRLSRIIAMLRSPRERGP
jgi:hypothetical protein